MRVRVGSLYLSGCAATLSLWYDAASAPKAALASQSSGPGKSTSLTTAPSEAKTSRLAWTMLRNLRLREALVEEPVARHADAHAGQRRFDRGRVVLDRQVGAGRVVRVVAGDCVEDEGAVVRRARHRPGVVQRPAQRHNASQRDAAVGRLDATDAAQRRGDADRAARVAAQRAVAIAGRKRRARAAAAAAGDARRVPGVARRRVVALDVGAAHGPLVQRQLAQHDDAGVLQPPHRLGVFGRVRNARAGRCRLL